MRRTYLCTALALIFAVLIFAHSQTPQRTTQTRQTVPAAQTISIERQVSTQQRINRYFHGDVMSKLTKCWSNVRGKGKISLKYTYSKTGARWLFSHLETDESTLPSGQDAMAVKCMLDSVRGSSFPIDAAASPENTFVLKWTWPVPFPPNANQLTTAMFAARVGHSVEGGCDGMGTPAKCYTCGINGECKKVCVGSSQCTAYADDGSPTQILCSATNSCASGGPFGVSGTLVMY